MSKLAQAIRVGAQQVRPHPLDVLTVKETWTPTDAPTYATEYRIGVSLQHRVVLTTDIMSRTETAVLSEAVAMVKDAVIEEVFGEFRPHFRAVELALWNRDFDAARAALRAMETQMFSGGES